jgi:putative acetyltransferase
MLTIEQAGSAEQTDLARELFREYQTSIGVDLCFQNFEKEIAGLPGDYAPPQGRLYLAFDGGQPAGCVGVRRIEKGVCELKRLYVRPLYRGRGIGRRLALEAVAAGRETGYARIRLDTLPSMHDALKLYDSLGFQPIAPYRENPVPGAVFLELELK